MRITQWGKKLKARVAEYMTRPRMIIRARSFYSRADLKLYMRKRIALAVFVGIVDLYVWSTVIIQSIPMVEHAMAGESYVIIREDSEGDGSSPSTNPEESNGETVKAVSENPKSEEGQAPSQVQPPSSIEAKIMKAWEGTGEGHIAVAIAKSESGLRPDAKGDIPIQYMHEGKLIGHSCGIFQIRVLPSRPNCEELKDIDTNIRFARKLYDSSGFHPWSNYKNGRYLQYMK